MSFNLTEGLVIVGVITFWTVAGVAAVRFVKGKRA